MKKLGALLLTIMMSFILVSCGKEEVVTVKDDEFQYEVNDYLKDMEIDKDDVYFADNIAFKYTISDEVSIVGQINEDNDNLIGVVFVISGSYSDDKTIENTKKYLGKTIECLNANVDKDEIFEELDIDNATVESVNSITKENMIITFNNTEENILLTIKGNKE